MPPVHLEPPDPRPGRPSAALHERIGKSIIYEDERLLVLDKPAGVAVHGGSGVSFGVIETLRCAAPGGDLWSWCTAWTATPAAACSCAKRGSALRSLHALLREDGFEKRYLALVKGPWDLGEKRIDAPLRTDTRVGGERTVKVAEGGKASVSRFRPVEFFGRIATLAGGDARDRAHAPDPRARRACRPPGGRG